jgi:hypothetical protein
MREEQEGRLRLLEDLLAQTQAALGNSFETWMLLKPGQAAFTNGIFDLTATSLTGTRSPFRKERVEVTQALDTARLYLLNPGSPTALQLVPLVRVIAGQKTGEEACYFYNRLLPDGVRWVSYHFRPKPELIEDDRDVVELLSEFRAGGKAGSG